jgi:hypothetical protein
VCRAKGVTGKPGHEFPPICRLLRRVSYASADATNSRWSSSMVLCLYLLSARRRTSAGLEADRRRLHKSARCVPHIRRDRRCFSSTVQGRNADTPPVPSLDSELDRNHRDGTLENGGYAAGLGSTKATVECWQMWITSREKASHSRVLKPSTPRHPKPKLDKHGLQNDRKFI